MAAAAQLVNPNADVVKKGAAAMMNINAARGLQDVLSSNLGPKGTLKMLVSGAGDIKLTKDGHTLLCEMQIHHPTANPNPNPYPNPNPNPNPNPDPDQVRDADPEPDRQHDRARRHRSR